MSANFSRASAAETAKTSSFHAFRDVAPGKPAMEWQNFRDMDHEKLDTKCHDFLDMNQEKLDTKCHDFLDMNHEKLDTKCHDFEDRILQKLDTKCHDFLDQNPKMPGKIGHEFEEYVLKIVEPFAEHIEFRKVFSNEERRFEIDIVSHMNKFCLCIDCKHYGMTRYRTYSLKSEAKKHTLRCMEFEKKVGKKCIPALVTLLDDNISFEFDCLIIPYYKFNYFLNNIEHFLLV